MSMSESRSQPVVTGPLPSPIWPYASALAIILTIVVPITIYIVDFVAVAPLVRCTPDNGAIGSVYGIGILSFLAGLTLSIVVTAKASSSPLARAGGIFSLVGAGLIGFATPLSFFILFGIECFS